MQANVPQHSPEPSAARALEPSLGMLLQMPGVIVIKDLSSRILAANAAFSELMALPARSAVRGRYEAELAPCLASAHDAFLAQDRDILVRRQGRFLDVLRYPDGNTRVVLAHKVCLQGPQGEAQGLLFQGFVLSDAHLRSVGAALTRHIDPDGAPGGTSYSLNAPPARRTLPPREAECLFFLLRGYSAPRIAARLHLSPRTVEGYIEQLKNRFGAATKTALVDTALAEGFSHVLPESLLHFP